MFKQPWKWLLSYPLSHMFIGHLPHTCLLLGHLLICCLRCPSLLLSCLLLWCLLLSLLLCSLVARHHLLGQRSCQRICHAEDFCCISKGTMASFVQLL
ncbi:hypothetical protein JB92DRAFT_2979115 [Gautieria morchelliformis]|nr:hypothetical protein JB92DRAFT_2979115 [Gautieria morchelliformis]